MRLNILIGGKAGQGLNELASILARAISAAGYYSFNYRDYGSWIAGGPNFNILCVSDKRTGSFDKELDIVVALDDKTLDLHKKEFKKNSILLTEKNVSIENEKIRNMYFAGALFKILGLDKKFLLLEVDKKFKGKSLYDEDVKAVNSSYDNYSGMSLKLKSGKSKEVMNGTEAVVNSSLDSGLNVYLGYPMTPTTGVLTMLAQKQKTGNHFVFEPENEIAVANMALGASFAGSKVMIGSSGGGFDLMTEALSAQGIMELPLVVHLGQRGSNSTGVPTYTGQGSLKTALYGGNGEFARVVIAPGDAKEAYDKTREAFYFSEKYNCLSILLTDKHLLESDYSFDNFEKSKLKVPERKIDLGKKLVRATSYEHTKEGHTTEDPEEIYQSIKKRVVEKTLRIKEEAKKFEMYKIYGKGKTLIVSYGSNKGAILDAIDNIKDVSYLHIMYLSPFPKEIIKHLEQAKKVLLLECDATGQLAKLIRAKTGFDIPQKDRILKYDARPFQPEEILSELKTRLK